MLEITGKDISLLTDSDLRSLIGQLCEADFRKRNLSTACITWGGHQDAKDGGIDVRVESEATIVTDDYVPRSCTGYQVKKTDLKCAQILKEMRPKGKIRPVIQEFADKEGAYIIVSGAASTADSALRARKNAMAKAVEGIKNVKKLKLDYYDRTRIASWARHYPSLIIWIRNKTGRPFVGWKPYENWANAPGGLAEEYLADNNLRILYRDNASIKSADVLEGISNLRYILSIPKSSVRLVGLSGVGKTRLLQALFDSRIGQNALDPSLIIYANIGDRPKPEPVHFVEDIIAQHTRAIFAIDNCPPEVHKKLTELCSGTESKISLITIEYDVREDQPQETKVFFVEPSSDELIKKLIYKHYKHIGDIDIRNIARVAGGNARIAISIASTIHTGETIVGLKDEDLFDRLFFQHNEKDRSLLKSAWVCSLVYSFDCRTKKGEDIELRALSDLAGVSIIDLYGDIVEIQKRRLVQERGNFKAILPQAIANRLAERALESFPTEHIISTFVNSGSGRLLTSFTRRLSFLHNCPSAVKIANIWLTNDGLLTAVAKLNDLGISMFTNVAPVAPAAVLGCLEQAAKKDTAAQFTTRNNKYYREITHILRALAYDPQLFERSVALLCMFALSEKLNENINSIRSRLKSLFNLQLSGTHASVEQRLQVIKGLIQSEEEKRQQLGLSLLDAALETWHFRADYEFEFGSYSRDYGYAPKNANDVTLWYSQFLGLIGNLVAEKNPIRIKAKLLLAEKFSDLWTRGNVFDELEKTIKLILHDGVWNEGWMSIRATINFNGKRLPPNILKRLKKLDELLKPKALIEQARTYAFSDNRNVHDLFYIDNSKNVMRQYERIGETAKRIGIKVGKNTKAFKELLPEMVIGRSQRLHHFGQGIAEGCSEPLIVWQEFRKQLAVIEKDKINYLALCGFLYYLSIKKNKVVEQILDEAVNDDVFGVCFPLLQTAVKINKKGAMRLEKALRDGLSPIHMFNVLAYPGVYETIDDKTFCRILCVLTKKPKGNDVVVRVLSQRFHSDKLNNSDKLISLGQKLLASTVFEFPNSNQDMHEYDLAVIVNKCLCGKQIKAYKLAKKICDNFYKAVKENKVYHSNYSHLQKSLAQQQPLAFLDSLKNIFVGECINIELDVDYSREWSPLLHIDSNLIIEWCEIDPAQRYPFVASVAPIIIATKQNDDVEWTPIILKVLDKAPNPSVILSKIKSAFTPHSWSGSLSETMQKRAPLFAKLKEQKNPLITEWVQKEEKIFQEAIISKREWEKAVFSSQSERFE